MVLITVRRGKCYFFTYMLTCRMNLLSIGRLRVVFIIDRLLNYGRQYTVCCTLERVYGIVIGIVEHNVHLDHILLDKRVILSPVFRQFTV